MAILAVLRGISGKGTHGARQPLPGLQDSGAVGAWAGVRSPCRCRAPRAGCPRAQLTPPWDSSPGCSSRSEGLVSPRPQGRCWQLLQPLQQLCCKEQHKHELLVDPKTRTPHGLGVPAWRSRAWTGRRLGCNVGDSHQIARTWLEGTPAHPPQPLQDLALQGARPGPPCAGAGCRHPPSPWHSPAAREGPARVNINPGRCRGLPGSAAPSTCAPAMRGLRARYHLLVGPA